MTNFLNCGVYLFTNSVTGMSYVGSSANLRVRWNEHLRKLRQGKHENPKLQNAWNKYGPGVWEFEVIAYCPVADLLWHEQIALDAFNAVKNGYNISGHADAPMRGRTFSEATKQLWSQQRRGVPKSAEHARHIGDAHIGMKRPAALGEKLRAMFLGRPATESQLAAMAIGRALQQTFEGKAKIGQKSREVWRRPERRAKRAVQAQRAFDVAMATYLADPKICRVCSDTILPLHNKVGYVAHLKNREFCSSSCSNRNRYQQVAQ